MTGCSRKRINDWTSRFRSTERIGPEPASRSGGLSRHRRLTAIKPKNSQKRFIAIASFAIIKIIIISVQRTRRQEMFFRSSPTEDSQFPPMVASFSYTIPGVHRRQIYVQTSIRNYMSENHIYDDLYNI